VNVFEIGRPIGDSSPDGYAGDRDHSEISTNGVSYKWYGKICKRGALYVHSPHEKHPHWICPLLPDKQDLSAQEQALMELGVVEDLIYTDHGLTGTNRARPGLD
jgi:hypothetical protein